MESKIPPYTLNETGKANLAKLFKHFELNEIFNAIDKGVKNYLKYDKSGKLLRTVLKHLSTNWDSRKLLLMASNIIQNIIICRGLLQWAELIKLIWNDEMRV
ncbi:hypothetical protein [Aminipila sp.]|uniref:hypothetical protein n=1 Tax=Aminipila sp. TaxID=2060095 RepID=UPI002898ED25|nr:hypothetical protein [Aminipila sp.]